jgi:hypothetical protein
VFSDVRARFCFFIDKRNINEKNNQAREEHLKDEIKTKA